jgi:hypothetical protein
MALFDSKGFWPWSITLRITAFLDFVLMYSKKTAENDVLEIEPVSVLR